MTNDEKIEKIIDIVEIDDSMNVTYDLYGKYNKLIKYYVKDYCFSSLPKDNSWFKLKLKLKCSEKNKDLIKFWIKLMIKIEPKITIENGYLVIPNLGVGKTMIILTAIRFLWEGTNKYDCIPRLTKNILDLKPDIDPLKAVLLANSCTINASGWGHSLVCCVVKDLKNIWQYRRYKGDTVHGLTNSGYGNNDLLAEIREAKMNEYDVLPVLKQYGYE
jgi:hypothetical protein